MGERMLSLIVILGVAVAGTFGLSMLSILVGVLALSAHGLKREADLYRSARALRLDKVLVVGIGANLHSNAIACGSAFLSGLSVIQIGALIDGFVRDHGGHLAEAGERRLFPQPRLEGGPRAQIVQDAGEVALVPHPHLTDRQVHGERRAVALLSMDLTADPDDASLAGVEVPAQVVIMLDRIRLGHQHRDVLTGDLAGVIPEQALGRGVEALDEAAPVDDDDPVDGRVDDGPPPGLAVPERADGPRPGSGLVDAHGRPVRTIAR